MSADATRLETLQDVVTYVLGLSGPEGLARLLDTAFPALYALDPSASEQEVVLKTAAKACGVGLLSVKGDWKKYLKTHPDEADDAQRSSQADRLTALIVDNPALELFHDAHDKEWVRLPVGDHLETHALRSSRFRKYAAGLFYEADRKVPNSEAISSALAVAEHKALQGPTRVLHNRVAVANDELWYDLGDGAWSAVRITRDGWEVVATPPVLFRRYAHQVAQVAPARGGDVRLLLKYANFRRRPDEGDGWDEELSPSAVLFLVFLVVAFVADIARVAFILVGPQGAGKSSFLRLVRRVVDPSSLETMSVPHDPDGFAMTLEHHACVPLDNLSDGDWGRVNDVLCRAITGDGIQKRELYTNDDAVIRAFQRFIVINGIEIGGVRPDLLDRSVLFELERIDPGERKPEREMWEDFDQDRPAILGGIFDALCGALGRLDEARAALRGRLPRMADATVWAYAVADAIGIGGETFLRAYARNHEAQTAQVLETNPLAQVVMAFMTDRATGEAGGWSGVAKELLEALNERAEREGVYRNDKEWPKSPASLGAKLNKLAQSLREAGVLCSSRRSNRRRTITLFREGPAKAVTAVTAVTKPVLDAKNAVTALKEVLSLPDPSAVTAVPRAWGAGRTGAVIQWGDKV